MLYTDDASQEISFDSDNNMYYREETEFIEAVVDGKPFKTADINSVYETMKIIFKERQ